MPIRTYVQCDSCMSDMTGNYGYRVKVINKNLSTVGEQGKSSREDGYFCSLDCINKYIKIEKERMQTQENERELISEDYL